MTDGLYSKAKYYDLIYQDKDYEGEASFVVEKFDEKTDTSRKALVLGCGTGEHSRRLDERGFDVVGMDASTEMLERAREKSNARFKQTSLPEIETEEKFGLVLIPFGVINYLELDQLETALEYIKQVLKDEGVLIFDNGDYDVEGEESNTMLEVFPGDQDVGRVGKTRRVEGKKMLFEAMIMTEQGSFADTHELWAHTNTEIENLLQEKDYTYDRYDDGYGTGSGKDHGTVFVAEVQ